jgi:hypothetical protein
MQRFPTKEQLKGSIRSHLATVPPEVFEGLRLKGARRKKVSHVKRDILRDRAVKMLASAKALDEDLAQARNISEQCTQHAKVGSHSVELPISTARGNGRGPQSCKLPITRARERRMWTLPGGGAHMPKTGERDATLIWRRCA